MLALNCLAAGFPLSRLCTHHYLKGFPPSPTPLELSFMVVVLLLLLLLVVVVCLLFFWGGGVHPEPVRTSRASCIICHLTKPL